MRITVTSVLVDDQQKALEFYTQRLGFVKKRAQGCDGSDGREVSVTRYFVVSGSLKSRNASRKFGLFSPEMSGVTM